jgi:fumarylpyruvate hydrolase
MPAKKKKSTRPRKAPAKKKPSVRRAARQASIRKAVAKPAKARAYVVPPPVAPSLPVAGQRVRFPVRRVYCVGRNYAEHSREMGHDPDRELPFFFAKAPDSLLPDGGVFPYPTLTSNVHHEIELVVAIGKGGADIPRDKALEHVYGYAVGLDMTRRDLQGEAKKTGRPWEVGKAFDFAAPCSAVRPAATIGHPTRGRIWLDINGQPRQQGDLADMIWPVPDIIAFLSRLFALAPGDLIFTGTPAGIGPVQRGDVLKGGVEGVGTLSVTVK